MSDATELELPTDTAPSRLHRPPKNETPDDVATAGERIEAFWERYPEGSILTEVESREVVTAENLPYSVYTVRAFVRRNSTDADPSSTAHATRSEADPDPVTAAFPQETAETSAVSRALKMIGILATTKKPDAAPAPAVPVSEPDLPSRESEGVGAARRAAELTQVELAQGMRGEGFPWTQAVVSKVERGTRSVAPAEAVALAGLIGYEPS